MERLYRAIVFDWDGTAVTDREHAAVELSELLSRVLSRAPCVIVSGTSLSKIYGQGIDRIDSAVKGNLFVCCNRGSEVFGFNRQGQPNLLYSRKASSNENRALDLAADSLRDELRRLGHSVEIICDRLNRRKIDLIPVTKWENPRKSQVKELFRAVRERLRLGNVPLEPAELTSKAYEHAKKAGLPGARVTSDIKHIEIGLTDKSDSMRWVLEKLLKERGIAPSDVLVVGDEFGSIGGIPGSDSGLRIPELAQATFVSVGAEPEGVPSGVSWVGGGPTRFLEILKRQIKEVKARLWSRETLLLERMDPDPSWALEQEGFDPSRERDLEALFTVGNGYLGVRGALSVPIPGSQTDLFIAGIYGSKVDTMPYSELEILEPEGPGGREDPFTELVVLPLPFELELSVDGKVLSMEQCQYSEFRRALDLKNAILAESMKWRLPDSTELWVRVARSTFLDNPHLLVQEVELEARGGEIQLGLDLKLTGSDFPAKHRHLNLISTEPNILFETAGSSYRVAIGEKIWTDGLLAAGSRMELRLMPGVSTLIQRLIVIYTSRESQEPTAQVKTTLEKTGMEQLVEERGKHQRKWESFWGITDIRYMNHPELTEAQRFSSFHLRAASNEDAGKGLGARALSGRAYEGHVFWDSEIFVLPFLLQTEPGLARAMLDYRYHTLDGARRRSRGMGCRGACFAWESTVTGDDVTPRRLVVSPTGQAVPVFTGMQQLHVTADIVFAIAKYWESTRDNEWMINQGLEIMIETARFWVSRMTRRADRYHLLQVVGPDEYHHDVDDNAFTNWMARFNLQSAIEWCQRLENEAKGDWMRIETRLRLDPAEVRDWQRAAVRLHMPEPNDDGVIEQFSGFFRRRPSLSWHEEKLKPPLNRLIAWRRVNEEQLIKQADVLMIPFLFPDALAPEIVEANYRYYEPRTDHGSSLSPCVHAAVAARIGYWEDAERFWKMGLELDLLNLMSNTALGVHPGNMGGTWQALVFHILGIRGQSAMHGNSKVRDHFLEKYGPVALRVQDRVLELRHNGREGDERWSTMAG